MAAQRRGGACCREGSGDGNESSCQTCYSCHDGQVGGAVAGVRGLHGGRRVPRDHRGGAAGGKRAAVAGIDGGTDEDRAPRRAHCGRRSRPRRPRCYLRPFAPSRSRRRRDSGAFGHGQRAARRPRACLGHIIRRRRSAVRTRPCAFRPRGRGPIGCARPMRTAFPSVLRCFIPSASSLWCGHDVRSWRFALHTESLNGVIQIVSEMYYTAAPVGGEP